MEPLVRIGAFSLALAAVFGAAYGTGAAVGPSERTTAPTHGQTVHDDPTGADHTDAASAGSPDAAAAPLPGLAVSQSGYTLQPATTIWPAGRQSRYTFRILGPDGHPVTDVVRRHDADLHLIVVRRDLTGYQHLHPTRDQDGTWSVPLALPTSGSYRLFADFTPSADPEDAIILGADLAVAGDFTPTPLPAPARTATTEGYAVSLSGDLRPGAASRLVLSVSRQGRPVTDLEPYLGAYGHLVVLRQGDLAYLHVHPDGEASDPDVAPGPEVAFTTEVPSAGSYRLFLDFSHNGAVHTAAFTATATGSGPVATPPTHDSEPHTH